MIDRGNDCSWAMVLVEVVTMKVLHKIRVAPTQVGRINPTLDIQTKIFLFSQTIFGINRLAIIPNVRKIYIYMTSVYSLLVVGLTLYLNLLKGVQLETNLVVLQYIVKVVLAFVFSKRLRNYYIELTKFDREVGCKPKDSFTIYSKITYVVLTILFLGLNFYLSHVLDVVVFSLPLALLSVHMVEYSDTYFCSHMCDLLLPRLQLINYYVESSFAFNYPSKQILQNYEVVKPTIREKNVRMKHIIDLYQIIVSAHELYVNAIKWQALISMTLSFMSLLAFSYRVSIIVIHGTRNVLGGLVFIGMLVAFLITIIAPCCSNERLHFEVLRLRELLATRLYDNKLDKCSRNVARALIALTESRDLSFSLMNMFNIDVSLPFTFTGLLVTYLIILLQFEKVINNN